MRHRRLRRPSRLGSDHPRFAAATRVSRLRQRGHRRHRRERCSQPERKAEGKLARLADRLGTASRSGRHHRPRAHALGDARAPSDVNAHPHVDCTRPDRGRPQRHHRKLRGRCGSACSRPDTPFAARPTPKCCAHLIEEYYDGDLPAALRRTLRDVRGAYALGVISSDSPDELVFARSGASPLVVGIGDRRDVRGHATRRRSCSTPASKSSCAENEMVVIGPSRLPADRLRGPAHRARDHAGDVGREFRRKDRLQALHAQGDLRPAAAW